MVTIDAPEATPDDAAARSGRSILGRSLTRAPETGRGRRAGRIHALAAVGTVALGVAIRVLLIAAGWPGPADSDEGTMGLMARHIAYDGAHPLIYYGQHIIGPQEAYLGAALFHLLGPPVFALRLGLVLLYVPFLIATYLLTCLLYDRGLALLMPGLFALGSPEIVAAQVYAGGHAETPLYCAALMLLASWLAVSASRSRPTARRVVLGWTAWTVLAGFAVWGDPLVTPFAVASGALLMWGTGAAAARRALVGALKAAAGAALVLLALVVVVPSLVSGSGAARVADALGWHGHSVTSFSTANLVGTLTESLPLALGANAACPLPPQIDYAGQPAQSVTIQSSIVERQPLVWPPTPCGAVHTAWAVLALLLGLATFTGALARYRSLSRRRGNHALAEALTARYAARLALLAGAGLTLLAFTFNPAPATEPWTTRRYLTGILVALPAVTWPLYRRARRWLPLSARRHRLAYRWFGDVISPLMLVALTVALAAGVVQTFASVPAAGSAWRQQDDLISHLTALGATRIYTDYWTCDRLAFATDERIVCATLNAQLAPDFDRYVPYRAVVDAALSPWYVFPKGSAQDLAVARWAAATGGWREVSFDGYDAYRPPRPPFTGPSQAGVPVARNSTD